MSAWIVSKRHIDLLVTAMMDRDLMPKGMTPDRVGAELWAENHRSVNCRYGKTTVAPPYTYSREASPSDQYLYAQIRCYSYQTCEHEEWEESRAFAWCRKLEEAISPVARALGDMSIPWGI